MSHIKLYGDLNQGPSNAFVLTGKKVGTKGQAHVFAELDPDSAPIPVMIVSATTPNIYNVTTTLADTEYSQLLPDETKQLLIRARTNATVKFAFTSGNSGTVYTTIPAGASFSIEGVSLTGITVYFQSNVAGTIVEINAWT